MIDWLEGDLSRLRDEGLLRERRDPISAPGPWVERGGRRLLNLGSNDYLSLASARACGGAGSGASRLIVGDTVEHVTLEHALAGWLEVEDTLLFSSGYAANVGCVAALSSGARPSSFQMPEPRQPHRRVPAVAGAGRGGASSRCGCGSCGAHVRARTSATGGDRRGTSRWTGPWLRWRTSLRRAIGRSRAVRRRGARPHQPGRKVGASSPLAYLTCGWGRSESRRYQHAVAGSRALTRCCGTPPAGSCSRRACPRWWPRRWRRLTSRPRGDLDGATAAQRRALRPPVARETMAGPWDTLIRS